MRYYALLLPAMLVAIAEPFHARASDTLEEYAQKCDQAVGVTVPDFNCDAGTLVPTTHFVEHGDAPEVCRPHPEKDTCDRPNRLRCECDPGSRFQVLTRSESAYVVAHCRKQGNADGRYGDIAVIQYSRTNGATCFYQALGRGLSGQVKAPSKGQSAYDWMSPSGTANIQCGACHDNGPLIRSPYLAQVTGPNALPGAGDFSFNRDEPYHFIGDDFASWKAYKVEITGNRCNECHRMGTSNLGDERGTALDLGIHATAQSEPAKNPHSADSPIWMTPGQITFSAANAASAAAIRNCAKRRNEVPLPNSDTCRITPYTEEVTVEPQPGVPGLVPIVDLAINPVPRTSVRNLAPIIGFVLKRGVR